MIQARTKSSNSTEGKLHIQSRADTQVGDCLIDNGVGRMVLFSLSLVWNSMPTVPLMTPQVGKRQKKSEGDRWSHAWWWGEFGGNDHRGVGADISHWKWRFHRGAFTTSALCMNAYMYWQKITTAGDKNSYVRLWTFTTISHRLEAFTQLSQLLNLALWCLSSHVWGFGAFSKLAQLCFCYSDQDRMVINIAAFVTSQDWSELLQMPV